MRSMVARTRGRSSRGAVKDTSVRSRWETFCTIMSTFTPSSARARKIAAATPGRSGTPSMVTFASESSAATPEMIACSIRTSSSVTHVPASSPNEDRTWIVTPYRRAYSTERACRTLAPDAASSSISSYDTACSILASGTTRGSAVKTPGTSVQISQNSEPSAAAKATAVVSDPPRPSVVTSEAVDTPWNPATITMFCLSRASRMRPGRMSMIRAWPWAVSVMIPACEPVYEAAGNPRSLMAMAKSDMAIRSPAVRSMSSSRGFGNGESRWAIASSSSVVWPIAETTTTTSYPSRRASTTRSATAPMRSTVSTEVPPYFWTMTATCRGYRARMPRWAILLDLRGSAGRSFLLRPPPPGRRRRAARVEHAAVQDGVPRPDPPPDHHTDALKAADHEDGEDGHGHGDERARLPLDGRDDRNQRHRHGRGQPGAPGRPARHDEQPRHDHPDRQQHEIDARGRRQPSAGHLPRVER